MAKREAKSNTIAIDIGSKFIKVIRGSVSKEGKVTVTNVVVEPTPEACMENGYIKSQTDLGPYLNGVIGKNDMINCNCTVVGRSTDIAAREISVPVIKGPKLSKLIRNEIVTTFGNTADYYTDYAILDTVEEDFKQVYKILAYAAPKEIVNTYFDLLKTADVRPSRFDTHRNVIAKLFTAPDLQINQEPVGDKVMLFVDLGATYMDIDLIADGKSIIKRAMSIEEDLGLSADMDTGMNTGFELDDQASEYSSYGGYEGYGDQDDLTDYMYGSSARSQISPILSKVNEELYKMFQFANTRQGGKPITNVYLYGGNSRINGLDQYLETTLGVKVERVCSMSNIDISLDVNIADILLAAGSLLRR